MTRTDIVNKIGHQYLTANFENDEFSYQKKLDKKITGHKILDLKFVNEEFVILVEVKNIGHKTGFLQKNRDQLFAYMKLESEINDPRWTIGILFDIKSQKIEVWHSGMLLDMEQHLNSFEYYVDLLKNNKHNDKEKVLKTTNELNDMLHKFNIDENERSQFIGCLLVALNNNLKYSKDLSTKELLNRIKEKLQEKIGDDTQNKKEKIDSLIKILDSQNIQQLKFEKGIYELYNLLEVIDSNLIPYINDKTNKGEDLLNLFFTTFNKYVGKKDKNQAFTPTHITDFMAEIVDLSWNSNVLDPTCGSGAFLVQAMTKMLHHENAVGNEEVRRKIKSNQIFGIEVEKKAFGLATTNMLIHDDGKSNVILSSCFDEINWIREKDIDTVLMNPPFNGGRMPEDCPTDKKGTDSTKGLYFVSKVADAVNKGKLATILPLQCAIGTSKQVQKYKTELMKKHTLTAVFSLPNEVFHPGASVNVCIMLWDLGRPHNSSNKTFFGFYKEDGFVKKKNLGRIEKEIWKDTKQQWLNAFRDRHNIPGFSVIKEVRDTDEWLAEAYMETNYLKLLTEDNFVSTIRDFIAYKVKNGYVNE